MTMVETKHLDHDKSCDDEIARFLIPQRTDLYTSVAFYVVYGCEAIARCAFFLFGELRLTA